MANTSSCRDSQGNVRILGGFIPLTAPKINFGNTHGKYLSGAGAAELLQARGCEHFVLETFRAFQSGNISTQAAFPGTCQGNRAQRECLLQIPPKIQLFLLKLGLREGESQPREPGAGCSQPIIHHSLSSSRSVISSSKEGMILLNILYSFPKRGIWIMKQDGIWKKK